MKSQYPILAAAITALLVAATALATTYSVFAYDKSQATAQANGCGNGELPLNIGCQNTGSQIQGDENVVAMASEQRFGQDGNGPTPPPVEDCIECFDPLSDSQVQALAEVLADRFGLEFPPGADRTTILEIICEALEQGPPPPGLVPGQINGALNQVDGVSNAVRQAIHACLNALF
jgi:hypothetical protein